MRDDVTWKRKEPLFNRQRRKKTIGRRQIRRRRRFDLVPTVPIRYTREKKEKQKRWEREREREREREKYFQFKQPKKKETKNGKWEKKLRKKSKTITKEKKGKPRDARWPPLPKGPHSVLPRFRFFFFHSFFLSFFLSLLGRVCGPIAEPVRWPQGAGRAAAPADVNKERDLRTASLCLVELVLLLRRRLGRRSSRRHLRRALDRDGYRVCTEFSNVSGSLHSSRPVFSFSSSLEFDWLLLGFSLILLRFPEIYWALLGLSLVLLDF